MSQNNDQQKPGIFAWGNLINNLMGNINTLLMWGAVFAFLAGVYVVYNKISGIPGEAVEAVVTAGAEAASAAGDAVESVAEGGAEAVEAATEAATEATGAAVEAAVGFHDIVVADQLALNTNANTAFTALLATTQTESAGMINSRRYLKDADGMVCAVTVNFGGGDQQVLVAANNAEHAPAVALGESQPAQTIRMFLPEAGTGFNVSYDYETEAWSPRWNLTVVEKPISDETAATAVERVLAVASSC